MSYGMLIVNNKIVLDTHILIWILLEPAKLSKSVISIITEAQENNNIFISSITLWEIAMLIHKKRINIYERIGDFLGSIVKIDGLNIIELNDRIAAESVILPNGFYGDPADCIIISSTREIRGTLITRDQKIITWAKEAHIKFIEA